MKTIGSLIKDGIQIVKPEELHKLQFDRRDQDEIVGIVAGVDGLPAQIVLGYEAQNDITQQRELANRKLLLEFKKVCEQSGIQIVSQPNRIQKWKKKIRQDTKRRAQRRDDMAKWSPINELKARYKELKEEYNKYKDLHQQTANFYKEEMRDINKRIKELKK
jgi:hypothetical protein